jgi:hypothetical protein
VVLPVNLPHYETVQQSDLVVVHSSCGGPGVLGNVHALLAINERAVHEVRPLVALVIHNSEHL